MNLKVLNSSGVIHSPAKSGDAGFDIEAISEPRVNGSLFHQVHYRSIYYLEYDTGLRVEPDPSFYLLLFPRSSIVNTNLMLANSVGVIDSGYRGNIKVCFKYIPQPEDMKIITGKDLDGKDANGILTSINPQRIYHKGDKIAQLVPSRHLDNINLIKTESLSNTERGSGGFGSTNK